MTHVVCLRDSLRHFDLPDVIAALAPRPCCLLNASGPTDEALSTADLTSHLAHAATSYSQYPVLSNRFWILIEPKENTMQVLVNWLQTT